MVFIIITMVDCTIIRWFSLIRHCAIQGIMWDERRRFANQFTGMVWYFLLEQIHQKRHGQKEMTDGLSFAPSILDTSNLVTAAMGQQMLQVCIALPSGRNENLSVPKSSKVGDLKVLAQKAFGQGFVKLVTVEGQVLTPSKSLDAVGIQDGDNLVAIAQQTKLATTGEAFALWCCGGHGLVTWGSANSGGNSSSAQEKFIRVREIQGTGAAFAAILADGPVVTWGYPDSGGDNSKVQGKLQNVKQIKATCVAFAAIVADGSVVTWGNPDLGGNSAEVQSQLRNVQQIQATNGAFAAILADGSVVTWGDRRSGGDSSEVQHQLRNVLEIQSTATAFAAILADGAVLTWGRGLYGGDSSKVQGQLRNVQQIQATNGAFAAILADGSVVTWGDRRFGGDSSEVQGQIAYL